MSDEDPFSSDWRLAYSRRRRLQHRLVLVTAARLVGGLGPVEAWPDKVAEAVEAAGLAWGERYHETRSEYDDLAELKPRRPK